MQHTSSFFKRGRASSSVITLRSVGYLAQVMTGHATRIQDLAKQLSDTLTAATASGELNQTWRMVEYMSFHDAIQILQHASNFPSE